MVSHSIRTSAALLSISAIWFLAGGAIASESAEPAPATTETQSAVSRLESLLNEQEKRIAELEGKLAASGNRATDAARTDVMRQQIRAILSEREFRESLMGSTVQAGYDNGFYIRSTDDAFSMKLNGLMHFRWTHYAQQARNHYLQPRRERDDRTGFDVQRLRLAFTGNLYGKDLTYRIEFQSDASDTYDVFLRYAAANYRFSDAFQITAGSFKIAGMRSSMTADGSFQLIDRPMTEAVFTLDRGLGIRFWGQLFDKRLDYYIDVVNSLNSPNNRTITTDPAELDSNPAIVFKAVWHALGENPGKDFRDEGDLEFHKTPALDFGFHYAFNEDDGDLRTTRVPFALPRSRPGGFGLTTTNGMQVNQFGWEAAFKFCGFSTSGEYILRILDPRAAGGTRPWTPWWLLTGDGSTVVQHGAYVQAGYFLPIPGLEKKLELAARVGGISTLAGDQEGTWEYAAGVNYYIEGNKIKLQADMSKISEAPITSSNSSLANVNDQALFFRVQLQVAF